MSDTDRIAQMAREAGFAEAWVDAGANPPNHPAPIDLLQAFARLVAEDCAQMTEHNWSRLKATERAHYAQTNQPFIPERFGFSSVDAEGHNIAQAIRARYSKEG